MKEAHRLSPSAMRGAGGRERCSQAKRRHSVEQLERESQLLTAMNSGQHGTGKLADEEERTWSPEPKTPATAASSATVRHTAFDEVVKSRLASGASCDGAAGMRCGTDQL